MRKILYLTFALVLFLANTAFADEILFRGVPWGSSMALVEKALDIDYFISIDEMPISRWEGIEDTYDTQHMDDLAAGWGGIAYFFDDELQVAGYNVSTVSVSCMYGIGDDGTVMREKDNSRFCSASYTFSVYDYAATYNDLKNKMISLYGDGRETIEEQELYYFTEKGNGTRNVTVKKTFWYGDNETSAMLYCSYNDADVDELAIFDERMCLYYGKITMDDELDYLQELLHAEVLNEEIENRNSHKSNVDGL